MIDMQRLSTLFYKPKYVSQAWPSVALNLQFVVYSKERKTYIHSKSAYQCFMELEQGVKAFVITINMTFNNIYKINYGTIGKCLIDKAYTANKQR